MRARARPATSPGLRIGPSLTAKSTRRWAFTRAGASAPTSSKKSLSDFDIGGTEGDRHVQSDVFRHFRLGCSALRCAGRHQARGGKARHDLRTESNAEAREIRPAADQRPELLLRRLWPGRAAASPAWWAWHHRHVYA